MLSPEREITWLRRVRDLSHYLADEEDPKKLLPMILDAAIELTEAERGFLVRVRGRRPDGGYRFKVEVARGFDKATLQSSSSHVSRTVVRRAVESEGHGLVTTDEEGKDVLEASSVQARRVLCIICVPMRLRGEVRGVLYLDHRFDKVAFTSDDLPILRTFADQAALAMETAEMRQAHDTTQDQLGGALAELKSLKETAHDEPASELPSGEGLSSFGQLIGRSPVMVDLYDQIERAARTWDTVLIVGDSGTGKELVAREIHSRGSFSRQPFIVESCAAGGEGREELFLKAGEGTLLLDDVGELPPGMQGKLVGVLQEGRVRLSGGRSRKVTCRVLATTRKDLKELARQGAFREDLYYRLDVLRVRVPSLSERPEDIHLLLNHFMTKAGRPRPKISEKAMKLLTSYAWPGNVRELENEARRLANMTVPGITAKHLSAEIREGRGVSRAEGLLAGRTLGDVEREMVEAAMKDCRGNKSRAARQLGIPRTSLYHLLERYGFA